MRKFLIILFFFMGGASLQAQKKVADDVQHLNDALEKVHAIIVHDVFTAPAASRIYAYSCIAAYEALIYSDHTEYQNIPFRLLPNIAAPEKKKEVYAPLAGIYALLFTAKNFIYSADQIQIAVDSVTAAYCGVIATDKIEGSARYAHIVADSIIRWSAADRYAETRTWPRYVLHQPAGSWQPTPPDHADAIEPYWGFLRPFLIDSAAQFTPIPMVDFSIDHQSEFYRFAMEVKTDVEQLTAEQKQWIDFWDDNPFTTVYSGHFQYAVKKLSPAGHWLKITEEAILVTRADMTHATLAYALVSAGMADAFISCWQTKYLYNTIRPETYINKYIDESWRPYLQTPPFPEYTSGHSTVSAAAATILTFLFGDGLSFTDSSETDYALPARTFSSFNVAANEASISRLYGGIHFRPAIENGATEGRAIGNYVIDSVNER